MDELSELSPEAADAAARSVRSLAAGATAVAGHLEPGLAVLEGWYGAARDGFSHRVLELRSDLETLSFAGTAGAALIEGYARRLSMLRAKLTGVDDEIAGVQRRSAAGISDLASWGQDQAELERWRASRQRVLAEFDEASEEFAVRLFAVLEHVQDRPRRFGEHVDDAAATLAAAAADTAFLGLGWIVDGPGWVAAWRQAPGAALDAVTHPVATLADAVAWDDWAEGRYGAGSVTAGLLIAGRKPSRSGAAGKVLPPGHRWARYLDARGDPLPQSLDELLAGVDLGRNEVFSAAHTMGRHVEVDDAFLQERLRTGAREDGRAGTPPPRSSRWSDEETAERVVTGALRDHAAECAEAAADGATRLTVRGPASADVGVVWTLDPRGRPVEVPVAAVVVVLERAGGGSWYVLTAFPDGVR